MSRNHNSSQDNSRSRNAQQSVPKGRIALIAIIVVVVFSLLLIYPSAREYYISCRQRDQLQAELEAVQQRNDQMQQQVDALNTNEGIEDQARSELNWTRPGEVSVTVEGVDKDYAHGTLPDAIEPGSVEAPEYWYTRILDFIFNVE